MGLLDEAFKKQLEGEFGRRLERAADSTDALRAAVEANTAATADVLQAVKENTEALRAVEGKLDEVLHRL